jgi:predicted short-subunit dehydrogenase-like oxidoreductase (DUF2520 family)
LRRINIATKKKVIESSEQYKIVLLGAGNVSLHISRHLYLAGHQVDCVWSRSQKSALRVAAASGSRAVSSPDEVPDDADFYLLVVSDSAIEEVASIFSGRKGIWMHAAGAVPLDVLKAYFGEYGVLYPLQTFSTQREVVLDEVPFLVEGSSPAVLEKIRSLAFSLSKKVVEMNSAERLKVHLAAVFANNFSNHMVTIATRFLKENGADFSLLEPILKETFAKMLEAGPEEAQSGPALRGDKETMRKHLDLLGEFPEWEEIYTSVSRDIHKK